MVVRLIGTREREYEVVKTIDEPEMVVITKAEYDRLERDSEMLRALDQSGVDNWEWYGEAYDLYNSWQQPENDCE